MMFPEPKYVIFSEIPLHPTFGTKISGLPYFYSVKLDVIGFGQKAHFWNRETSYIKVLGVISHELDDVPLKVTQMTRELWEIDTMKEEVRGRQRGICATKSH